MGDELLEIDAVGVVGVHEVEDLVVAGFLVDQLGEDLEGVVLGGELGDDDAHVLGQGEVGGGGGGEEPGDTGGEGGGGGQLDC